MKIVRIIRLSALESTIARFDRWWDARAPRERLMLSVLGVLIGGVVLVYGVIFSAGVYYMWRLVQRGPDQGAPPERVSSGTGMRPLATPDSETERVGARP